MEMIHESNQLMLDLIKASLWGTIPPEVGEDVYNEMQQQAIVALPANIISLAVTSPELQDKWKKSALQQVYYYTNYKYQQSLLPIEVPYVILKGTSASKYYPHPEYRAMGDIDVITRHEDYEEAFRQLESQGYKVSKSDSDREDVLDKNGIAVELHRRFASLNDPQQAEYLDTLIVDNINPTHVLPDLVNGLVLLEHISQHLENGLGLRQIIDWMMFVDKCLSDEAWTKFEPMADKIGLKKLAVTTTRMCEIYLGLPEHSWCTDVELSLCKKLISYVLECGNFGVKKTSAEAISENAFAYASTPKMAFKLLQKRGNINWKMAQKHRVLRPFAWIYQAIRYAILGLHRDEATSKLRTEYKAAQERNAMFDALGVKTAAKGIVIYKDGKYIKT